jgi:hypothetical protein
VEKVVGQLELDLHRLLKTLQWGLEVPVVEECQWHCQWQEPHTVTKAVFIMTA